MLIKKGGRAKPRERRREIKLYTKRKQKKNKPNNKYNDGDWNKVKISKISKDFMITNEQHASFC